MHLLGALDSPVPVRSSSRHIACLTDDQQRPSAIAGQLHLPVSTLADLDGVENIDTVPMLLDEASCAIETDAIYLLELVSLVSADVSRRVVGQADATRAVALMVDPPLILATSQQGTRFGDQFRDPQNSLSDVAHDVGYARAVVMVTHNAQAAAATDRVITLADGALMSDVFTEASPALGRHSAGRPIDSPTDRFDAVRHDGPDTDVLVARAAVGRHAAYRL
jgi:putative ABC transport system ATP-binding protein